MVFLGKGALKICSKFAGTPMPSVISIKLLWNFIKIALRHGSSPINLLHIFRTPFPKNTSGWLLLSHIFQHSVEMMEYNGHIKYRIIADCTDCKFTGIWSIFSLIWTETSKRSSPNFASSIKQI